MKKTSLITTMAAAITLVCSSPAVLAQSKSFEGVDLSIQLGLHTTKSERTALLGSSVSRGSNYTVQAQYSVALSDKFVLGLGAWGAISDIKMGDVEYSNSTTGPLKLQNMASVYIAPGYAVNDSVLVYGKIGRLFGKWGEPGLSNLTAAISPIDNDMLGTSFGLGIQIMASDNLLYRVELLQNQFQEKNLCTTPSVNCIANLSTTTLNGGVGYKF